MKLQTIKTDRAINFADCVPQVKEIMLDAFDHIMEFENAVDGADPDDFEVHYSSDEPTNNFGGAFITSIFGSYLLHDLREEQIEWYENDPNLYTVVFYSLTKISDNEILTIRGVITAPTTVTNNMVTLNLTIQETLRLHGFLESMIKIVNEKPDLELTDRINTTAAFENIMSKIDAQLEIEPNNN